MAHVPNTQGNFHHRDKGHCFHQGGCHIFDIAGVRPTRVLQKTMSEPAIEPGLAILGSMCYQLTHHFTCSTR